MKALKSGRSFRRAYAGESTFDYLPQRYGKNIVKAVERCGLKVDQLIFAGLAASYSVLTEDERELGVCVVDIGGGTMDIAVYTGGALRHTKVIPYAGTW